MPYDLKITGGSIIDGTGQPRFQGHVGITGGKVVALGHAPDEARETIDAKGRIVAPGFVDIHTHYDAQILWDRMLSISPWHGVTTVVMGNCGFGVAPTRRAHRDLIIRTLEKVEGMREAGPNVTRRGPRPGPGPKGIDHRQPLARSLELAAQGHRIYPQVTPRPLNFEFQLSEPFVFESMSLFRPVSAADFAGKKRLYADAGFRKAFRDKMDTAPDEFVRSFGDTLITEYLPDSALDERPLAAVARERGMHAVDLMLDLGLATDFAARFRMPVANHNEDEVAELLLDPHMVLGLSDAGAHASQLCDACQATYLLGRWVREKQALSLEQAVRMLTSRPAEVFGIADRGRLAEGWPADVVVFDPAAIGAGPLRRIHDFPGGANRLVSDASGIDAVIVNGTVLRRDGSDALDPDGKLPGQLLRHGRAG